MLVIRLSPSADFDLGSERFLMDRGGGKRQSHKQASMPAEAVVQKWLRCRARFVRKKLCLDAMNSRRLLQGFDHVREQPIFHFLAVEPVLAFADEQIANDAFVAFVDEEGVPEDLAA